MEEELICSICHDYFYDATTISCSHTFCKLCITNWQKRSKNCPVCRQPIKQLIPSQALNALANHARERYNTKVWNSFDKTKAKNNVSKGTNTTIPVETPSTSGTTRSSRSPITLKDLGNALQSSPLQLNNENGRILATLGSSLAGFAVDVINKKISEKVPAAAQLTNVLASLGRSKMLGGELKGLLQSAVYKATGRTIPEDVLDSVLIGYSDAGGNYTTDMATKLISNITDQIKNTRYYYNDSSDSDDDDKNFQINIKYID